jgi:peptidoglycan/LPS O-acetylase OafA/YrhL
MTRRFEAGPLLALLGAILLLASLFLAWYEPSTEAWDAFEITDLLLAAIGLAALVAALAMLFDLPGWIDARWLPWLALAAFVLVLNALLSPPPQIDADPETGLWLALAGAALLAAGALLVVADVAISLDVSARERRQRVSAVDARRHDEEAPAAPERIAVPEPGSSVRLSPATEKTEPLPPTPDRPE